MSGRQLRVCSPLRRAEFAVAPVARVAAQSSVDTEKPAKGAAEIDKGSLPICAASRWAASVRQAKLWEMGIDGTPECQGGREQRQCSNEHDVDDAVRGETRSRANSNDYAVHFWDIYCSASPPHASVSLSPPPTFHAPGYPEFCGRRYANQNSPNSRVPSPPCSRHPRTIHPTSFHLPLGQTGDAPAAQSP